MNKKIIATLLGGASLLGMTSQASAAPLPTFTVDPTSIATTPLGGTGVFTADSFSGLSSGLITLNGTDQTATETGWVNIQNFNLEGNGVSVLTTGLGVNYSLYMTYSLTTSLKSGGFGQIGSEYNIDSLTWTMFAAAPTVTFIQAALGSAPDINTGASTITKIATGSLFTAGPLPNSADITDGGGVALNSWTTFNLSDPAGPLFFTSPTPFFNVAINEFNNTSSGIGADYDLAVGCASGQTCQIAANTISHNWNLTRAVPEPATLALLGIGLLGLGASRRSI